MTVLGKHLRAFLLNRPRIAALVDNRVHQNRVPQGYNGPYIWFTRATVEHEEEL